jgi:hypothetical protein
LTFFLIIVALLGLIPAFIAERKGRNFILWWFYGSAFFLIALVHALIMKSSVQALESRQTARGLRKCPFCAEMIKPDAIVCRYCGRDLPAPAPPAESASALPQWKPRRCMACKVDVTDASATHCPGCYQPLPALTPLTR